MNTVSRFFYYYTVSFRYYYFGGNFVLQKNRTE